MLLDPILASWIIWLGEFSGRYSDPVYIETHSQSQSHTQWVNHTLSESVIHSLTQSQIVWVSHTQFESVTHFWVLTIFFESFTPYLTQSQFFCVIHTQSESVKHFLSQSHTLLQWIKILVTHHGSFLWHGAVGCLKNRQLTPVMGQDHSIGVVRGVCEPEVLQLELWKWWKVKHIGRNETNLFQFCEFCQRLSESRGGAVRCR